MKTQPLAFLVLMALCFSTIADAQGHYKRRFGLRDGQLYHGIQPFTVRAVKTPALFELDADKAEIADILAAVSEVGANTVMFDLQGLSADGRELDPKQVANIDRIMAEVNYRYLGAICRIFNEQSPTDPAFRETAAKTVAKAMKRAYSLLYWIDGPGSDRAVAAFRKKAGRLAVVAPRGGHVTLVRAQSEAVAPAASLLVGSIPQPASGPLHSVLLDMKTALPAYDRAMAHPLEGQTRTPSTFGLTDEERADGWISLFNGKNLDGWVLSGQNPEGFVVKDGVIEWDARGGGTVRSLDRFDDFILRLDVRIVKNGNSGIFVRAPRANRSSKIGMEFQVMGDYGLKPGIHTTGAIYSVVAPKFNASAKPWEWNTVELLLDGSHFRATFNGQVVQDLNLDENEELSHRLRRGFIGLQDHGHPVSFRNIKLKKL